MVQFLKDSGFLPTRDFKNFSKVFYLTGALERVYQVHDLEDNVGATG
jgi:hypothetical protein